MILCITPDHEVYRYADDTPTDRLQELWDDDCVILQVLTTGISSSEDVPVLDWIGATGDVPAVGWARIEHKIE